ncbi:hypothetical protein VE04_07854 [Pseudogymnoascus sp. 24MN13]|nr:hypothetical protein VE04_07854 [Pseudogymnoascus sp. 24MN13]
MSGYCCARADTLLWLSTSWPSMTVRPFSRYYKASFGRLDIRRKAQRSAAMLVKQVNNVFSKLGSGVKSTPREQDTFPSPKLKAGEDYPALIESVDYRVEQKENLGKLLEVSANTAFKAQATKILSSTYDRSTSDTEWLGPCELFRDLIKRALVRKWLRDEIKYGTKKVYFVVGYFTSLNATTFSGVQQGSRVEVKGIVLGPEIVTYRSATLVSRVKDLDVSGSVKREGSYTTAERSYMRGKRMYAFCYREVKWNIFRLSDKAATAKLHEDNC